MRRWQNIALGLLALVLCLGLFGAHLVNVGVTKYSVVAIRRSISSPLR